MESQVILMVFNNTGFVYGTHGIVGFVYDDLKDNIRWAGLPLKKYVPKLKSCLNYYLRGVGEKN